MPHTNPWTNILPLGSQQASTADDELRKLRLDIFERCSDFIVDWTADPVVLSPTAVRAALGSTSGYKVNTFSANDQATILAGNDHSYNVTQLLPDDIAVQAIAYVGGACTVVYELHSIQLNTGVDTQIASVGTTISGPITPVLADNINATIGTGLAYYLKLSCTGGLAQLLGHSMLFQRPV